MSEGYAYSMGGDNKKNDIIMEVLTLSDRSKAGDVFDLLQKISLIGKKDNRKQLKAGCAQISITAYMYSKIRGSEWFRDDFFYNENGEYLFWE